MKINNKILSDTNFNFLSSYECYFKVIVNEDDYCYESTGQTLIRKYDYIYNLYKNDSCICSIGIIFEAEGLISFDMWVKNGTLNIDFIKEIMIRYKGFRCVATIRKGNKRARILAGHMGFTQKSKSKKMILYSRNL